MATLTLNNPDALHALLDAATDGDVRVSISGDEVDTSVTPNTHTFKVLVAQGSVNQADSAIAAPGVNKSWIIHEITVTNISAITHVVTFGLNGTAATAANRWGPRITLPAGSSVAWGDSGWSIIGHRIYGPAQPSGAGNATLATATSPGRIKSILLCNTTGAAATVTLALNGTSATAANCFLYGTSVSANDLAVIDLKSGIPFNDGDTIQGQQGTASAVTVVIGVDY